MQTGGGYGRRNLPISNLTQGPTQSQRLKNVLSKRSFDNQFVGSKDSNATSSGQVYNSRESSLIQEKWSRILEDHAFWIRYNRIRRQPHPGKTTQSGDVISHIANTFAGKMLSKRAIVDPWRGSGPAILFKPLPSPQEGRRHAIGQLEHPITSSKPGWYM